MSDLIWHGAHSDRLTVIILLEKHEEAFSDDGWTGSRVL